MANDKVNRAYAQRLQGKKHFIHPSGFDSFDLDRLKPIAILFQTGYLTIREEKEYGLIQLDYPNKEVQNSMLEQFFQPNKKH